MTLKRPASPCCTWRVVPGTALTSAWASPGHSSRLYSVDFPALAGPTMATLLLLPDTRRTCRTA